MARLMAASWFRERRDLHNSCLISVPCRASASSAASATADALVHRGETVVRERLIIHRDPPYEKAAAGLRSATAFRYARCDHQKVANSVRSIG
jgi:hypothetical protein